VPFTANQFDPVPAVGTLPAQPTYYVEVLADGFWANVAATVDGDTLTLESGMAAQLNVGDQVVIRPHITLLDYLGDAASTPLVGGLFDIAAADNVIVLDGLTTTTFFYETSGTIPNAVTPDTWVDANFNPADHFAIQPDAGLQIVRKSGGATTLVFSGNVDENERQVAVNPGVSVRPVVLPSNVLLGDLASLVGSLNGIDGLTPVDGTFNLAAADEITVLVDGSSTNYYADNTGTSIGTFINSSFTSADADPIPAGAAIVINRKFGGSFTWSIPAPVITP
jgi:hypothetical protein